MKYIKFPLLMSLGLVMQVGNSFAKNADITCIYRETIRKDITQPVPTQTVFHSNATDMDCCSESDTFCQNRLKRSVQEYCNRSDRVPNEYSFSTAKVMCGKNFIGGTKGIEYSAEE